MVPFRNREENSVAGAEFSKGRERGNEVGRAGLFSEEVGKHCRMLISGLTRSSSDKITLGAVDRLKQG